MNSLYFLICAFDGSFSGITIPNCSRARAYSSASACTFDDAWNTGANCDAEEAEEAVKRAIGWGDCGGIDDGNADTKGGLDERANGW